MNVYDRIDKMLVNYLKAEKNIVAFSANFGDTEESDSMGCDTCGYGSSYMSFEIHYRTDDSPYNNTLSIEGDPLGFFPTLLEYDTEDL